MKKLIYVTILSALTFSACEKSKTGGCIDLVAINYEKWADYDDGSCLYQSDVVFYEDVAAAVYFANEGVNWLDININGDYTGTLQANLGFEFIPDCYPLDPDAVHFTIEWEDAPATSFTWTVRDETGYKWYEGTEAVVPNDCTTMGLTWEMIKEYQDSH